MFFVKRGAAMVDAHSELRLAARVKLAARPVATSEPWQNVD
jgi:hypothetical protein